MTGPYSSKNKVSASFIIREFKHNYRKKNISICTLGPALISNYCLIKALMNYLRVRGNNPGPLSIQKSGFPVSRIQFDKILEKAIKFLGLDTRLYKTHSFHIGTATYLTSLGHSDDQIQCYAVWQMEIASIQMLHKYPVS